MEIEFAPDGFRVTAIETVLRELLLLRKADVPVGFVVGPTKVIHAFGALQKCANALKAVSEFDRDGIQVQAAALLEVRELGDLEAIEENLPADAPSAESRRLPIVLFKANVMFPEIDADGGEAF